MLDLVRLKVLAAVSRHGSVTRAARELGYAQPSVSHHLSRLQAEVGVRLTQRVGRGIRLTPAGELLAQRASEILGRVESAEEEIASIAELRGGRVRVGGFHSALSTVVARAAAALHASAPGIEINLTDLHPDVALEQLRLGSLDVAVVFRYDDSRPSDVNLEHLFDDPMYLLSRRAGETLADHKDSPWIAGCERCRQDMLAACQAAGFTPRVAYTSDDPIVEQSLVAAGLGVTTMPGLSLSVHREEAIEASEVAGFRRRVSVATYGEPPDPPATAAFVDAVIEAASHR